MASEKRGKSSQLPRAETNRVHGTANDEMRTSAPARHVVLLSFRVPFWHFSVQTFCCVQIFLKCVHVKNRAVSAELGGSLRETLEQSRLVEVINNSMNDVELI